MVTTVIGVRYTPPRLPHLHPAHVRRKLGWEIVPRLIYLFIFFLMKSGMEMNVKLISGSGDFILKHF